MERRGRVRETRRCRERDACRVNLGERWRERESLRRGVWWARWFRVRPTVKCYATYVIRTERDGSETDMIDLTCHFQTQN
jgi:hypothetical protein